MKKILLIVLAAVLTLGSAGCMGAGGNSVPGVSINDAPDPETVKALSYDASLKGLEAYLTDLCYLPKDMEPTEMMSNVIGAKEGHRFNITVERSAVTVELYEYDPDSLNEEGKRVIAEVQKNGKFYVFEDKSLKNNQAFEAALSNNGKYLVIYSPSNSDDTQVQRKKDFVQAVRTFA